METQDPWTINLNDAENGMLNPLSHQHPHGSSMGIGLKLANVSEPLVGLLEEPPVDNLPSFAIASLGQWKCKKCKGRRFAEKANHRLYFYNKRWRKRCAPCALKVRAQLCKGVERPRTHSGRVDVDVRTFATDPNDRVYALKSSLNQRADPGNALARHGIIYFPAKELSGYCGHSKYVQFYGEMSDYLTCQGKSVPMRKCVPPVASVEISLLTESKAVLQLRTAASAAVFQIDLSCNSSSQNDGYIRFPFRWDCSSIQLWKGDEAVLTAPLEYSDEIDIHSSPGKAFCCNLVRSNVPAIRVVLLEDNFTSHPQMWKVNVIKEPSGKDFLRIRGMNFAQREEPSSIMTGKRQREENDAVQLLTSLRKPRIFHNSVIVTSGTEPLEILKITANEIICRKPDIANYVTVWVRRFGQDGSRTLSGVPKILALEDDCEPLVVQSKLRLGHLEHWTTSNTIWPQKKPPCSETVKGKLLPLLNKDESSFMVERCESFPEDPLNCTKVDTKNRLAACSFQKKAKVFSKTLVNLSKNVETRPWKSRISPENTIFRLGR